MQQMQLSMGRKAFFPQNVSLLQNPKMGRPHPRTKNLNGRVFGDLTAIGLVGVIPCQPKGNLHTHWLTVCVCQNFIVVRASDLLKGTTSSCGCTKAEKCRQANIKHGEKTRTHCSPEYKAYLGAKERCCNPNNRAAKNYSERGIEFRFNSFEEFLAEVDRKPSPKHSLDRIDNDGHYEKGNVRWATRKEQANNSRRTRFLTIHGITKCLTEWADESPLQYATIKGRSDSGWCDECSLFNPSGVTCTHQ